MGKAFGAKKEAKSVIFRVDTLILDRFDEIYWTSSLPVTLNGVIVQFPPARLSLSTRSLSELQNR